MLSELQKQWIVMGLAGLTGLVTLLLVLTNLP